MYFFPVVSRILLLWYNTTVLTFVRFYLLTCPYSYHMYTYTNTKVSSVLCLLWLIPFFIILLLLKRWSSGHPIRFNTTRKNTKGVHTLLCLQGTISYVSSFLTYRDKHLGRIMIIHICSCFHSSHISCLLDFRFFFFWLTFTMNGF